VYAVTIYLNHLSGHRIAPLIQHGGAALKYETRYHDQNGD
jgi:hypothetical protein